MALRAEVDSLYSRLGSDVSLLEPGEDVTARQGLADASDRYAAARDLLCPGPGTVEALMQAKRVTIEGIMATRLVRQRLGFDPGPDPMPPAPPTAPQIRDRAPVDVGGQTFVGYGQYRPGASNYFGGGTYRGEYIPGGWYAYPFWQTAAVRVIAFGGLGYVLGGGARSGFDIEGVDDDELFEDRGGSGGDWGGAGRG